MNRAGVAAFAAAAYWPFLATSKMCALAAPLRSLPLSVREASDLGSPLASARFGTTGQDIGRRRRHENGTMVSVSGWRLRPW
jgi:hypothetical protein